MLDSLYGLQDFTIFLILIGITTSVSVVSIILSKRFIFYRLKYRDNATIASISSLIGIIYGVLVGFLALYLLDNNDHASNAVLREANSAANIYRQSQWLRDPVKSEMKEQLESYIDKVIKIEWPLMRKGKDVDVAGDGIIQKISETLKTYSPQTSIDNFILQDLLTELKTLYSARHDRINMSTAELSPALWEVILIGTILIIGINYAFRVNFFLHLFGISAFAIMASAMLFLLVTLDRPFQGEFIIEPDALGTVLNFMKTGQEQANQQASLQPFKHHPHIHSFHRAWAPTPSGQA